MIKSFLRDNNIKQVYVSNKCPKLNTDFSEFNGYNKKINTLFYGIYEEIDFNRIFCHKSKRWIYWCIDNNSISENLVKKYLDSKSFIRKINGHICDTKNTCEFLDKLSIKYTYLPSEKKEEKVVEKKLYDQFMDKYNKYSENNIFDVEQYEKFIKCQEEIVDNILKNEQVIDQQNYSLDDVSLDEVIYNCSIEQFDDKEVKKSNQEKNNEVI